MNNNIIMFLSIFKNVLLIFILILILHFLIKNKLSDTSSKVKRQMIIKDTTKGTFFKKPLFVNKADDTIESSIEEIEITDEQKDKLYGVTDSGSGLISEEIVKKEISEKKVETFSNEEKPNKCKIPCADFLKTKDEADKDSNIKALYEFVFSEEKSEDDNLNKYFPSNVIDQVNIDKTEIDKHHNNVELNQESSNYKYEVIGNIKEDNVDGIEGIDSMGMSNFSNL